MEAGYRCFRVDASIGGAIPDNVFNTHERVRLVAAACKEIRDGVGQGDWMIDFHQKFDFADALRCCRLIEDYEPFLVEDPVRDEQALEEIPKLRMMTTCPLSHGEEWGQRWDFHRLVYNKDIDYIRGDSAERRRHHRDGQDHGVVRDVGGRDRSAFHGTGRDGRARAHDGDVLRPGADGIQLRGSVRLPIFRSF